MPNRILGFSIASLMFPIVISGFPVSMDIGTFSIDDYTSNGGGMGNLSYMIAGSQNFFWAANSNIPGYSSSVAAVGSGTNTPSLALDLRNTQVTKAAIINTGSGYGSREYCDFVYYGGHGFNSKMFLGNFSNYGFVSASETNLGTGYTRWIFTNSCSLFNGGDPATLWQPAFKGLKAMLGFRSFIFDNNLSWDLYNDFWTNWTYREKSLMNAFFDSEANYGYKHLYPAKGLETGCLSALTSTDFDYCREAYKFVAHDYNKPILNSGNYYAKKIGTPQY